MNRANFIGAPEFFNLNQACRILTEAYGYHLYLVGSSMKRRDFRDVDLRMILDDDEFDVLFPKCPRHTQYNARWSILCAAISLYLSQHSGLPIDFQFQRSSDATRDYPAVENPRNAIGIFLDPPEKA